MSLEDLVEEIRRRGESELRAITDERARETARLAAERNERIAEIRAESSRATEQEVARERAQRLAAAKLQARKQLYEAREERLGAAIAGTRELLEGFTATPAYAPTLKRMFQTATDELGKSLRVRGRSEDASLLNRIAGKSFDPTPLPILGGLVAETADGSRRLNLAFDELLRLREDRVRELLA